MTRRIIQIAATVSGEGSASRESLYALDDEGKVWIIDPYQGGMQWSELPGLPPKPKGASMLDTL